MKKIEYYKKSKIISYGIVGGVILLAVLPIMSLVWIALNGNGEGWPHLIKYVLPKTVVDTIILLIATAIGTCAIGVSTAWMTSIYQFPAKKFFSWALMMPLAIPPYIAAYTMVEVEDKIPFIDIQSVLGAAFVFSIVLYPYVYLITRISLAMQRANVIEVARSLGAKPKRVFWEIAMPLARPAIVIGVALVMMETLNDIGAVEYLGVRTITFAVFETWLNRNDLESAVQLSILVLGIIIVIIALERQARRNNKTTSQRTKPLEPIELPMHKRMLASAICAGVIAIGFGVPVCVLVGYVVQRPEQIINHDIFQAGINSAIIGVFTAIVTVGIAFFVMSVARIYNRPNIVRIARVASLGYAMPGTVLAIGLLYPITAFDNFLAKMFGDMWTFGLLLSGSAFIIVYGCSVRFLTIAWGNVENGFNQLSENVDMAARGLGRNPWKVGTQIHLPILKGVIAAAALFVFVDTCKELSATLILRPIGFETLATLVYDRASQAVVEEGALAACLIIILGLLPLIWIAKTQRLRDTRKFLNF